MTTNNPWLQNAERNKESAQSMVASGHRDWGLFVWHLALEKLLKGVIYVEGKEVPLIHDLTKTGSSDRDRFYRKAI